SSSSSSSSSPSFSSRSLVAVGRRPPLAVGPLPPVVRRDRAAAHPQLNPTGANAAGGWEPRAAAAGIRRLAAALPDTELILQVNDETRELFRLLFEGCGEGDIRPSNLAALLDASCGRGVAPEVQSLPVAGAHCGYAGGMGPETIDRQLREIAVVLEGHPDTVWIDMESGVRTRGADGSDVFDLAKVRQ
ncbi:unnamed protein product, partial [Prorocentrum cordatum]